MQDQELEELLHKYKAGNCTEQEIALLESWYIRMSEEGSVPSTEEIEAAFIEVRSTLPVKPATKIFSIQRIAAAAALIVVSAAAFYLYQPETSTPENSSTLATEKTSLTPDALPGGNRAVLTLSDGSAISLDDANSGSLAKQGGTEINKTGKGELVYESGTAIASTKQVLYNTVSTPRGGQYQVTLPDGTKVWLNAASSLRFPTEFTGSNRQVTLTGEAYFEVAENKSRPFLVNVNESQVEVLGTHFNVMAYADELLTTTLLEGSVKFRHGEAERIIKPGQAARLRNKISVAEVNTDEAVAWKNGVTAFSNADIYSIMRQISRWYDLDVEYRGTIPDRTFTGKIPRTARLSKVLRVLELSDIHFRIEEKKIIVSP